MNEFRFVFCRRSDGYVNSLYSFYEMSTSVKQVLIIGHYYQLKRCDLQMTPSSHDYPTKNSISLASWENERFDRENERVYVDQRQFQITK